MAAFNVGNALALDHVRLRITQQLPQLDRASIGKVRKIYFESFPPSERVAFSHILDDVSAGQRKLFLVMYVEEVIGFALTMSLKGTDVHLLEYMAVAHEYRNLGLGSALMKHVSDSLCSTEQVSGLLLEVESPEQGTSEEMKLRRRRLQFYCRNGARVVECAPCYRTPNLAGEGSLEMKLMWLPLTKSKPSLLGDELRKCICAIFVQSYEIAADAPLLQSVLNDLVC